MNIGILGLPRTGTSATYQLLKAALPVNTLAYFEPPIEPPLIPAQSMLCKMLVYPLPGMLGPLMSWVAQLDKCVILHRDPRDRLISSLLFLMHWHNELYPPLWQREDFAALLASLERKVHQPSLPLWPFFEQVYAMRFGMQPESALYWIASQQDWLIHYQQVCQDTYALRYESLIAGEAYEWLQAWLSPYAMMPHDIPQDPQRRSIKRDGASGAWRQWFTPEDCAYFADTFAPYCAALGYVPTDKHYLVTSPSLDPGTSSHYVKTWVRVQRRALLHASA